MRKVLLLLSVAFFFGISSYAQTDMQITAVNPTTNGVYDSVANGDTVTFSVTITNLGPSALNMTDTVFVDMDLEWLIGFPGYVFRFKGAASTLNCRLSGQSDVVSFSFYQGVSLGQTAAGPAIPVVPNFTYLNNIKFRVYGYTSTFVLLNDVGLSLNSTNNTIVTAGNNELNPTNVFFGQVIQPTVAITTNDSVSCSGKSVTFTATAANPGTNPSYQWKLNNVNVGTNSPTFISNTLANNDVVKCVYSSLVYTVPSSVTSNSISMAVSPNVTPIVNISVTPSTTVNLNDTVTFTATSTNGGTNPVYKWYKNQTLIAGATSAVYKAVAGVDFITGSEIYATLTSSLECSGTVPVSSTKFTMTVNNVGIRSTHGSQLANLKLYPNPNKGQFIIEGELPNAGKYTISIINQLGQQVFMNEIQTGKTLRQEVLLDQLGDGIYVLVVSNRDGQMTRVQFVKAN